VRIKVTQRERDAMDARGLFDAPMEPGEFVILDALCDGGLAMEVPDDAQAASRLLSAVMDEVNAADDLAQGRNADPAPEMRKFHRGDRDALSRLWDRIAAAHHGRRIA
jgi:hypothetical protein